MVTLDFFKRRSWDLSATLVVGVFSVGLLLRIWASFGPIQYDESHTLNNYLAVGFFRSLSDYRLANNHILHTMSAWFTTRLFGYSVFSFRLPAFIFGVMLLPASYFVALHFFNRRVALYSMALVALSPLLIRYSSEARGYSLQALITCLSILSTEYEVGKKRRWFLPITGLLSALGMFTLITHVFAVCGVYLWAIYRYRQVRGEVFIQETPKLLANVAYVSLLALVLYTPVLSILGPDAFLKKQAPPINFSGYMVWMVDEYLLPKYWYFAEGNGAPVRNTCSVLLGVFVFAGWKRFRFGYSMWFLFTIGVLISMLLLKARPYHRNFLFFLPICVVGMSAGLDLIQSKLKEGFWVYGGYVLAAVLFLCASYDAVEYTRHRAEPSKNNARLVYQALEPLIHQGDHLLLKGNMAGRIKAYLFLNKVRYRIVSGNWTNTVLSIKDIPDQEAPVPAAHQVFSYTAELPARYIGYTQDAVLEAGGEKILVFSGGTVTK